MKEWLWRCLYPGWKEGQKSRHQGYTPLLMVPGDLPVFLDIAIDVLSRQDCTHLIETLVIPDRDTSAVRESFDGASRRWPEGKLRWVDVPWKDQSIAVCLNNPGHNHWLQHVRGINAVQSTHALIHDADLFIGDDGFLRSHYERCRSQQYVCYGVNGVWDDWYGKHGYHHLVATWELMVDVEWFRHFPPWQHRGHKGVVHGFEHVFDTTLLPQCKTDPTLIGRHAEEPDFVHFNYVISSYRWFQRQRRPFVDEHFRLLLIRLLMNAYGEEQDGVVALPSLDSLETGISDVTLPVIYPASQVAHNYPTFRRKLSAIIDRRLLDTHKVESIAKDVKRFDIAFGF